MRDDDNIQIFGGNDVDSKTILLCGHQIIKMQTTAYFLLYDSPNICIMYKMIIYIRNV